MNEIKYRRPDELDASIRLISHYDCGTDSTQTRFDVLMGDEKLPCNQYPWGMTSGHPGQSPLHIPDGRGIIGGFDVKVSSEDLVVALRSLANAIESHKVKAVPIDPSRRLSSTEAEALNDAYNALFAAPEAKLDSSPGLTVNMQKFPDHLTAISPVKLCDLDSENDRLWRALRAAAGG